MANKRVWLGMLVMVLVFGITVVGCNIDDNGNGTENGNGNGNGNVVLNGTWAGTEIIEWSTGPHWRYCYNFIFGEGCDFPFCNDCIWVDKTEYGTSENRHELALNNDGTFKISRGNYPYMKGTFSTNSGKIAMNPTHYSGLDFPFGFMVWMDSIDPPWYSKNEMETEIIANIDALTSIEEYILIGVGKTVNDLFASSTSGYFVKGNTLTINNWAFNYGAETQIFTREN